MSSTFTERLYLETKESHTIVDKHPFVSLIRKNKLAGEMYINFNKICIYELQLYLKLKDSNLQSKLYRDIEQPDMYITSSLSSLLKHCKEFNLESSYQFYLGLLFGGNMLKKMLPEHYDFLTYTDSKELISEFKEYLNENVTNQTLFIKNANDAYKLIKCIFDEFYEKLSINVENL
jgi:hypothetical protein